MELTRPPPLWHGHEMLYGFIVAAIAGFLLTAVPSWTGRRGFAGWPLGMLAALWLLARALIATSAIWPLPLVAAIDLMFLPALIGYVVPPLVRERNRNTPLLAVLAALWGIGIDFYWGLFRADPMLAGHALLVAIDVILLLVTVIGGRIVPAFSTSALRQRGIASPLHAWRGLTPLSIGIMVVVAIVDLWKLGSALAGWVALVAAVMQAIRLAQIVGFAAAGRGMKMGPNTRTTAASASRP